VRKKRELQTNITIVGTPKFHLYFSNTQGLPQIVNMSSGEIIGKIGRIFNGFPGFAIVLAILRAKMYRFAGFRRGVGAAERAGFENRCALY
jgi:hypothetical protein